MEVALKMAFQAQLQRAGGADGIPWRDYAGLPASMARSADSMTDQSCTRW